MFWMMMLFAPVIFRPLPLLRWRSASPGLRIPKECDEHPTVASFPEERLVAADL
jgi:hypothetical protein